jgi:drug/metabolite transporter (DMT)-like permease
VSDALRGVARMAMRSPPLRHLMTSLVAIAVALALLAVAFGFLVATLYLALVRVVEPPLAALLTSLILALVAALILLFLRLRRPRRVARGALGVDALLLAATDQVGRDPWSAIVVAAVLGAITEVLRSTSAPRSQP